MSNEIDLHILSLVAPVADVASQANRTFRCARSGDALPCHARSLREQAERLEAAAATLREAAAFADLRLMQAAE